MQGFNKRCRAVGIQHLLPQVSSHEPCTTSLGLSINQKGVKGGLCGGSTPSLSGLLLRRPGSSLSLWLTSSTLPDKGAYYAEGRERGFTRRARIDSLLTISDAAFTLSTAPIRSVPGRVNNENNLRGVDSARARNRRTSFSKLCTDGGELDEHNIS